MVMMVKSPSTRNFTTRLHNLYAGRVILSRFIFNQGNSPYKENSMGFTPKFTQADINKEFQTALNKLDNTIIRVMQRVAEEFVNDARDGLHIDSSLFPKKDYKDQTANLRNSIGYAIIQNSIIIKVGGNTSMGKNIAKNMLELSAGYKWILIGYAAMDYASYVESKGYNVISSQKQVVIVNLNQRLKKALDNFHID